MTVVVNLRKSEYDVYIGRSGKGIRSIWGNPFSEYERKENIRLYEDYLFDHPELVREMHKLRDKRLGCFCKPKPCHGDVLVRWLNLMTDTELARLADYIEAGHLQNYTERFYGPTGFGARKR